MSIKQRPHTYSYRIWAKNKYKWFSEKDKMKNIKKNTRGISRNMKEILVKTFLGNMISSVECLNCMGRFDKWIFRTS